MVRLTSYSISSTYKCQSTAFVLAGPPAVAGRALWNSICPSFFSCCLSGCFLGIGSLGFSEFWHGARNPYLTVHDRTTFFSSHFRDLQKLKADQKVLGGHCQKWVWPVWSQDSKIDCISNMSRWNKLIFCMLVQIRKAKSWFNDFWVGMVKNGHCFLVRETIKYVVS